MYRVTIIESEISYNGKLTAIRIDHLVDDVENNFEYTGSYEATLGNGKFIYIEMKDNAWIETGGGETELAREIGKLIESYVE